MLLISPGPAGSAARDPAAPIRVQVVTPAPGLLSILQAAAGPAAVPLATTAFVARFIVFILMQRKDLRNRLICLVGFGDLQCVTLAMSDAANRPSRYVLAQVLLNTGFGLVVAAALAAIGVSNAILRGIAATLMLFVPYIGSAAAALFPVTMAAATSDGWGMVAGTALVFALAEVCTGQVVEPWSMAAIRVSRRSRWCSRRPFGLGCGDPSDSSCRRRSPSTSW